MNCKYLYRPTGGGDEHVLTHVDYCIPVAGLVTMFTECTHEHN